MLDKLRSYKVFGYAVFDLVVTLVVAAYLTPFVNKYIMVPGFKVTLTPHQMMMLSIPLGVVVHKVTNTSTPMTEQAFDPHGHMILKIVLIALVLVVICGAKRVTV